MESLEKRYAFATRIPIGCFVLTLEGKSIRVTGSLLALPASFCTVDQICVSDGKWLEIFDEERLARSEALERLANTQTPSPCHCPS